MAIKGKKKNRGSAGARRPAGAPRPTIEPTRRKSSFWRSRDGIMIAGIFVIVGIGVAVWLIGEARSSAREEEQAREVLTQYADRIQPVLMSVNDPVEQMANLTSLPAEDELEALGADIDEWTAGIQEAQIQLTQVFPPPSVESVNQLFNEGLGLYSNAASLLRQVTTLDVGDDERAALFTNFATQRDLATALFESAIGAYDALRDQVGLDDSSLAPPVPSGQQPPSPAPGSGSTEVEVPTDGDQGGGGSDG